jgi:histidine ammonia-lyase
MATFAARRLQAMLHNTAHIVGIELLAAAQGIEFLRPLTSSAPLESLHALIRSASPAMMQDRSLSLEMTDLQKRVMSGDISAALDAQLPELRALQLA